MLNNIRIIFETFVLIYFVAINGMYTIIFIAAFFEVKRQHRRSFIDDYEQLNKSKLIPGISLCITAFNEDNVIVDCIKSYLSIEYPKFEVIVICDGSTDNTLPNLIKEFKLIKTYRILQSRIKCKKVHGYYISKVHPNLIVLYKTNGGKADALNAGINAANYQYYASLDADAMLEKDALLRVIKPIYGEPNTNIGAGGIVRVLNDCSIQNNQVKEVKLGNNPLVIFQVIEYIRAFTAGRAGFSFFNALPIASGAFSVYNSLVVRRVGGYDPNAIGEDYEMITRLHRALRDRKKRYRISYQAYPICWTEVPETLKALGQQRNRWHRGLIYVLHKYEKLIFNPRYGRIGFFSLPFFFFFEFIGPIIEFFGYGFILYFIFTGKIYSAFFLIFLALAVLWGMFLSVLAILFEDLNFNWYKKWYHIFTLIIFAILENISYRQLTVIWRIHGLIDYLRGDKSWGTLKRKGFNHAK